MQGFLPWIPLIAAGLNLAAAAVRLAAARRRRTDRADAGLPPMQADNDHERP